MPVLKEKITDNNCVGFRWGFPASLARGGSNPWGKKLFLPIFGRFWLGFGPASVPDRKLLKHLEKHPTHFPCQPLGAEKAMHPTPPHPPLPNGFGVGWGAVGQNHPVHPTQPGDGVTPGLTGSMVGPVWGGWELGAVVDPWWRVGFQKKGFGPGE